MKDKFLPMFRHFFCQVHFFSVFFRSVLIPLKILYCIYIVVLISEVYSEPSQISKMKFFAKLANVLMPLTIFAKKTPS